MKVSSYPAMLAVLSALLMPLSAWAQAQSPETMECVVANDFYMIHFSAFQKPSAEDIRNKNLSNYGPHCQDLPAAGMTAMTVDLFDRDARTMPISIRLIQEEAPTEQGPGAEMRLVMEEPARIYDKGILEVKANLDQVGHYALILTVGEEFVTEDDRVRIPIRVGLESDSDASVPRLAITYGGSIFLIVLIVFLYLRYSGRKRSDP